MDRSKSRDAYSTDSNTMEQGRGNSWMHATRSSTEEEESVNYSQEFLDTTNLSRSFAELPQDIDLRSDYSINHANTINIPPQSTAPSTFGTPSSSAAPHQEEYRAPGHNGRPFLYPMAPPPRPQPFTVLHSGGGVDDMPALNRAFDPERNPGRLIIRPANFGQAAGAWRFHNPRQRELGRRDYRRRSVSMRPLPPPGAQQPIMITSFAQAQQIQMPQNSIHYQGQTPHQSSFDHYQYGNHPAPSGHGTMGSNIGFNMGNETTGSFQGMQAVNTFGQGGYNGYYNSGFNEMAGSSQHNITHYGNAALQLPTATSNTHYSYPTGEHNYLPRPNHSQPRAQPFHPENAMLGSLTDSNPSLYGNPVPQLPTETSNTQYWTSDGIPDFRTRPKKPQPRKKQSKPKWEYKSNESLYRNQLPRLPTSSERRHYLPRRANQSLRRILPPVEPVETENSLFVSDTDPLPGQEAPKNPLRMRSRSKKTYRAPTPDPDGYSRSRRRFLEGNMDWQAYEEETDEDREFRERTIEARLRALLGDDYKKETAEEKEKRLDK